MAPDPAFSPYVGLEPYDDTHHEYFFGREAERRLIGANARASRLTVLHGQSGAGKTSVLRAGVARDLLSVRRLSVIVFGKWQSPSCLADLKLECEKAAGPPQHQAGPVDRGLPFDDFLVSLSEACLRSFVIVLDQFEEYLFYHPQDSEAAFDPEFARAINREDVPANFLLTLRSDSLSKLDRFRVRIPNLLANILELKPLTQKAGREAIRKPLEVYNARFPSASGNVTIDDRVIDELIGQLRVGQVQLGAVTGPDRASSHHEEFLEAPFLQLVLVRLWQEEMIGGSRALRFETLRRLGGPQTIVKMHLDAVMDTVSSEDRSAAARMFFFLVTPSGSKIALRSDDLAKYAERSNEEIEPALRKLADARILCRVAQTDRYEILHDVLAPAVLDWRARYQARQQRNKRIWMALLGVVIAASVLYAGYFMLFQRHQAESRRLALEALNVQGADPELAVVLAMYSVEVKETEESLGALHRALQSLETREVLRSRHGGVRRVSSSRDGRWLAWTGEDGSVTLRDLRSGQDSTLTGHAGPVLSLAFSPDSPLLATAGQDGFLIIRNVANNRQLQRIHAHDAEINAVAFGPNGKLATGSGDASAKIWQAGRDTPVVSLSLGDPDVLSIAFRPDGGQLVTGDSSGGITTWNAVTGLRLAARNFDGTPVLDLAYSPDGRRLAALAGSTGRVLDLQSGSVLELRGHQSALLSVAFSPSGEQIGTAGADRTARLWDSGSGTELATLRGHNSSVTGLAFLGADARVATSSKDETVRIWDNPPNTEMLTLAGHRGPVYKIAASPDGTKWATASADGTARIWDARTGRPLRTLEGHTGEVASVSFNRDSSEVVTGGRDKSVRVWGLREGKSRLILSGHGDAVVDVAFSPDRKRIASASWDGTAKLWSAASGALLATLSCEGDHLSALAFGRNGSLLYTAGQDARIRVWDAGRASLQRTLTGHEASIYGLVLSRSGEWIASSDANGMLKVWNAASGEVIATVASGVSAAQSVGLRPSGSLLASAGRDGSVSEWDWRVPAGRPSFSFLGHQGPVYSVAYSPDGKRLASAGEDRTARVYALDRADLLALARKKIASRSLTAGECRRYLQTASCPAAP